MEKLPLHCVSEYVAMTDGVRLAVTAWLPVEVSYKSQNFPVVLLLHAIGEQLILVSKHLHPNLTTR